MDDNNKALMRITTAKKTKMPTATKFYAVLLVICIFFSGICGFLGGWIATGQSINQGNTVSENSISASQENVASNAANNSILTQVAYGTENSTNSLSSIVKAVENSVVEIRTEIQSQGFMRQTVVSEGAGSGVIISENGMIVTNNHVIDGAQKVTVRLKNGESYDAKVIGVDEKTDVALLKIEATGLNPAVIGKSSDLLTGDLAIAVGNPLGELGGTVSSGIISALDREITLDGETMNLLQTDAAINPGNSGGGLFDANGKLIGIVVAKTSGTGIEGIGFAIPIDDVVPVIDQLITYGYVRGRVNTGLTFLDVNSSQMAMMYRVNRTGVYILNVEKNSNAAAAGLKQGDYIVSIGKKNVSSTIDITSILADYQVGDEISVSVIQSGETKTFSFVLTENVPSL